MTLYKWSQTASADASADSTINWAEGQAPSSVNDSARAMMAATAKYRDDIAGAIVTTGSSTAYAVSSYQGFDTLAHLGGQMIAFTPHTTNGQTVTLNVDSLGAKPLRPAPGTELLAGTVMQGTPYVAVYNNIDGAFYLQGFFGNPYNIPLAGGLDYWGPTAPNSAFAFPIGQAISRATYAPLFALVGTTYGVGDGSTTFNLPDRRGRVSAQLDPTGTILTSATITPSGDTLGATGGAQAETLTAAQIPEITSNVQVNVSGGISGGASTLQNPVQSGSNTTAFAAGGGSPTSLPVTGSFSGSGSGAAQSNNTGGAAHPNVQPTIMCNYIIRIV